MLFAVQTFRFHEPLPVEGTGAVTLFPLLDMALRVYNGTHTFDDLGMEAYTPQGGTP